MATMGNTKLAEGGRLYAAVDEATLLSIHDLDVDLPVSCDMCSKKFYDLNVFDNHMLTHKECRSFFCQFCNNTYQSWGNLVAHRKACHHGKVLSCEDCGKRKMHLNLGTINYPIGDLMHGCEECNEGFNSMPQLIRHYSKKHSQHTGMSLHTKKLSAANINNMPEGGVIVNLVCPLCKWRFLNLEQLTTHIKKLGPGHRSMTIVCNICRTEFCNTELLKEHMTSHKSSNITDLCTEFLVSIEKDPHLPCIGSNPASPVVDDNNAKGIIKEQVLLMCPFCVQDCTVPAVFVSHIKLHMSRASEETLSCKICNVVIENQKDVIKHLESKHWANFTTEYQNIIRGIKANQLQKKVIFTCKYCGRKFNKKETLSLHVRRHLGERPYRCVTCGRSFYTNQQLTVHRYIHNGKELHLCKTQASNKLLHGPKTLLVHHKLNSTTKTYTCSHCNRQFLNQSSYIVHVRLHTGHQSFTCSFCKKIFTLKSKLNVHLKTHHQSLVEHKCLDCGTCFDTENQLTSHCSEESCVTLVTLTKGNKSEESENIFQNKAQYIIRFSDHDV